MARFVDRAVLHLQAGDGGHGCASVHREKFKPLGRPGRWRRRQRRRRHAARRPQRAHPARLPLPPARQGRQRPTRAGRRPGRRQRGGPRRCASRTARWCSNDDGTVLADLVGVGATYVAARGGRGGLGNAALASRARKAPGFRAARRAGRHRGRHARAQERRRRRAWSDSRQRRKVLAGLGAVRGPPEDRRLPVHHPGTQSRRGHRRVRGVHHRRRARSDPWRQPGQAAWAWSSSGTSNAARCWSTWSTAPP